MESAESVLAHVSIFAVLRPDEVGRVARRFETRELATGETLAIGSEATDARLLVVVRGRLTLFASAGDGTKAVLEPGDRYGDVGLVSGHVHAHRFVAEAPSVVALLDRAGLDALLVEFPAIALPLALELARELAVKNDAVREILELHAEKLPPEELAAAVEGRRRQLARRGARVARLSPRALFYKLVVAEGAEPPFWMLTGFVVSLALARLVVHLILKYHLEKQLFALVPGDDPNPMHVHHFNYGLVLIGAAGLAALFPFGRRGLRLLALAFGFGCGLVFDEFALIWNLNPEYANPQSLIAAGIAGALLVQITYFRAYWRAVGRRAWLAFRSGR